MEALELRNCSISI